MRLFELINTQTKTTNLKSPFDKAKLDKKHDAEADSPTAGSYALGSDDKKDPHMYKKDHFYPSNLQYDGYAQYVNAIKPYMDSNPYFPRVYMIKVDVDPKGRTLPKYSMEKLQGPEVFSSEALIAMGNRMFSDFSSNVAQDTNQNDILRYIAREISDSVEFKSTKSIIDKGLIQAINIIGRVMKLDSDFRLDIHKSNVMLRGSKNGPQLVITDPIWDKGRNSQIK